MFDGVDAILLETFTSTAHMKAVLALVKAFYDPPPVTAQLTPCPLRRRRGW